MAKKKKFYASRDVMLTADPSAIANMPQDVKMVPFPKTIYGTDPDLNDRLSGLDAQINKDISTRMKYKSRSKY